MKRYEEKEVKCLISKPRGLLLARRRRSLRRAGVFLFRFWMMLLKRQKDYQTLVGLRH